MIEENCFEHFPCLDLYHKILTICNFYAREILSNILLKVKERERDSERVSKNEALCVIVVSFSGKEQRKLKEREQNVQ